MSNTKQEDYSSIEKKIKWSLRGGGLLILLVFGMYFINFNGDLNTDPDKWGPFGDFIGGTLNPILAALAFYWLTASIRLQIQELRETKVELRKAAEAQEKSEKHQEALAKLQEENLKTQNQILNVQKLTLESQQQSAYSQQQQIAKQNFENLFFELIKSKNDALRGIISKERRRNEIERIEGLSVLENIQSIFIGSDVHLSFFYDSKISLNIGSYFRVCENILELIFQNKELINSNLKYINIFSSTLTQVEMKFIFYAGLFNKRLKFLLEELGGIEALDFDYDVRVSRKSDSTNYAFLYHAKAFGNNKLWSDYFEDFKNCNFRDLDLIKINEDKKVLLDDFTFTFFDEKREFVFGSIDYVKNQIEKEIKRLSQEIESENVGSGDLNFQRHFDIDIGKLKNRLDKYKEIEFTNELYVVMKYNLDLEETLKLMENF
jgi:hypothetical protein